MARVVVAAHFVWDAYPGLRVGMLYSGQGDLGRHPRGATHAVDTVDAVTTLCGLPREAFPLDFAETVSLRDAEPCRDCGIATPPAPG